MQIYTENEALADLLQTGATTNKKYRNLPIGVVKGFIKAYKIMKNVNRIEDLYRHKGLNYEKIDELESVRCNDKYRLMIKSCSEENSVIITNVELIKITNHYEDL